jgi:hypothetical protein
MKFFIIAAVFLGLLAQSPKALIAGYGLRKDTSTCKAVVMLDPVLVCKIEQMQKQLDKLRAEVTTLRKQVKELMPKHKPDTLLLCGDSTGPVQVWRIQANPPTYVFKSAVGGKFSDTLRAMPYPKVQPHVCYTLIEPATSTIEYVRATPIDYKHGIITFKYDTFRLYTPPVYRQCVLQVPKGAKMMSGKPNRGTGKF